MKEPNFHVVQNVVDEGTLEVIPKLQARTAYLAMIGNIATLIGLMGTIYGLIVSFRSVGDRALNQAVRATELASGISVAMNTTLTGLAVAIPSILVYTILRNKTNQIIDEIDEHTVKLINLITPEEKV
jgi:biopolymer transport protein ExbB/TolQ